MFNEIDKAFFQMRAREARSLAESASDMRIASIHRSMAKEYEARAGPLSDFDGATIPRNRDNLAVVQLF